jgi:hypothetical protein
VRYRRRAAAILAGALVLRLLWAVAVPVAPMFDSVIYDLFARNLAAGLGYSWEAGKPTVFWPVGTAFLYSLPYRAFGPRYLPATLMNVAFGVAVVALAMRLTRGWFGPAAALVAGGLLAAWPGLVEFTTILASELPFMAVVLGALAVWDRPAPALGPFARAVPAGLLLAAASYLRPTALLLPALFAVVELRRGGRLWPTVGAVALMGVVVLACLLPWSARNARLFGRFVLVSANGGVVGWMGNNPCSDGLDMELPGWVEGLDEVERDRVLQREASAYIRRDPLAFVGRAAGKLVRMHKRESIGVVWNLKALEARYGPALTFSLKLASNLYWFAALALGLVGAAILVRRDGWLGAMTHPTILLWGYFAGVHSVTLAQDRYHFPCIPAVAALAALAVVGPLGRRLAPQAPTDP